jgi:hypothetical protein
MAKLVTWSPEEAKKELARRLSYAGDARRRFEKDWLEAEAILFTTRAYGNQADVNISHDTAVAMGVSDVDQGSSDYNINYAHKNWRFICSQLASNPPAIIARPQSSDFSDRRKADAADRLSRYAKTQYLLQEFFELGINNNQTYGTAITKVMWDTEKGEPIDFDEKAEEITLTGDISVSNISPWNFFIDPDASTWEEVKFVFEKVMMPYEEACFRFPDAKETLKKFRMQEQGENGEGKSTNLTKNFYDVVEVYQYWEKGLAYNGFIGRMCWCTKDGSLVTPVAPNPYRFAPPKSKGLGLPEEKTGNQRFSVATLPYHVFTDGDLPGHVWGKANILYATPLQDLHTRLYNNIVNAIQAHGIPRLILPEGADIGEETITNSPWDIIRITGSGQDPRFMEPMAVPAVVSDLVTLTKLGIDDMSGVNESMFGKQSREQSGFSMQYATSQGNLIRQRVFNKYRAYVESVYKGILNLIRKYWTDERTIHVLGKEKAFESIDISGADIDGGFDLVVEYGSSLSVDPTARREEVFTLLPLFKEAGIDIRTLLSLLKLNDLEGAYDRVTMAADRQREFFDEMIATDVYIKPEELQDHKNMLAFAYDYLMSAEFKYLKPEHKKLIEQHVKEREALALRGPTTTARFGGGGGEQQAPAPSAPPPAPPVA